MSEVNIMAKLPEDVRMKGYMLKEQAGLDDRCTDLLFTLLAYAYCCGQLDGVEFTKDPTNNELS